MGIHGCLSVTAVPGGKKLAYPMINMSTLPSETFGPNREVMSSGGTAEPTFHVTMYTLSNDSDSGNAALGLSTIYCRAKEDIIWAVILREIAFTGVSVYRKKISTIKHLFVPR